MKLRVHVWCPKWDEASVPLSLYLPARTLSVSLFAHSIHMCVLHMRGWQQEQMRRKVSHVASSSKKNMLAAPTNLTIHGRPGAFSRMRCPDPLYVVVACTAQLSIAQTRVEVVRQPGPRWGTRLQCIRWISSRQSPASARESCASTAWSRSWRGTGGNGF